MRTTAHEEASVNAALRIADDAWHELRRSPSVTRQLGIVPARLPDVSFAEAQRRAAVGAALLRRLDALKGAPFSHDLELTLRLVRFRATMWSREAEWYWLVTDPLGLGFYGEFLPTAYCGGLLLNTLHADLAALPFKESGDTDRYLALVSDYARLIHQFADRTLGQAERGMFMPRPQVVQARTLLSAFKAGARRALGVAPERLALIEADAFSRELMTRITARVDPAFDRAIGELSAVYLSRAPETVGLGQYAGGSRLYADLVKLHTTMDLTPEEVHARGHARVQTIEATMQEIRRELRFGGTGVEFVEQLNRDPRWRADTVEGVTAVFQRYIDRLEPRLADLFTSAPKARYGIAALPEALQGSMTFGYYDEPQPERPEGVYLFNARNLTRQGLFHIGALTYHELMPGHHMHLASQQENATLHPLRAFSFVNAYNEGWAEYAATLAGEIGLYEQPEERYGRLMMDAFLTCRLIVDTGMNALGWSLDRARDYMREHSGMAESDVLTETVRYSCDIPGQALAYKLGDTQILALRDRMHEALGSGFDLKRFHETILGPGALPLRDLAWHVEHEIARANGSLR